MPMYLQNGPHGFCQRCGFKTYLRELWSDGEQRGLLVCKDCDDEDHPQKYPVWTGPEGILHDPVPPVIGDGDTFTYGNDVEAITLILHIVSPMFFRLGGYRTSP